MSDFLQQLMPQPGERIADRYRIERILGEGGFGVVYLARQENLDREVAIKMLLPAALADRTAVQRFQREVDLVRRLEHPNTVRIFDRGETPKGLHFYVMEYVKGQSLGELLHTQGAQSPKRARVIAEQVLMSLGEAHEKGIVHRDLKPGNIMLTDVFGRGDFVKVLDFGIGKLVAGGDGEGLTTRGIIGTPFYMSPEQVKAATDLDGRSDLYALGLIIHEMLTKRRAIDGPSPLEVVMAHLRPEPVVLDAEVAQGPLGDVVLRATQKDRTVRYQSALEMLEDLQQVQLDDTSRQLGLPSTTPRRMAGPVLTPPSYQQPMTPQVVQARTLAAAVPGPPRPPRASRAPIAIGAALVLVALALGGYFALNRGHAGGGAEGSSPSRADVPAGLDLDAGVAAPQPDQPSTPGTPGLETGLATAPGVLPAQPGPLADRFGGALEDRQRRRQSMADMLQQAHQAIGNGRRLAGLAAEAWPGARAQATPPDVGPAPTDLDAGMAVAEEVAPVQGAAEPVATEPVAAEPIATEDVSTLTPDAGVTPGPTITATIRGTPGNARVRLGDETVCRRLPCDLTLPPGDDEVRARVSADGFRSETIRLRREPGHSYSVELWREYR